MDDCCIEGDGQGIHDDSDEATFEPAVFGHGGHACVKKFVHGIITITLQAARNEPMRSARICRGEDVVRLQKGTGRQFTN